jgi:two-component system sensor histidine kinase/response regulator
MTALAREPAEILLIDDDLLSLTATAAMLDRAGYIVHQARDRQSALKAGRTIALDLVISDVHLAGESGLDLFRDLRLLPGMEDVPVMFISASQLPDIVRRSHVAGGAYYLRKPLDPEVLIELVDKALWLPHLVQSRLSMHRAASQPMPAPRSLPAATSESRGDASPGRHAATRSAITGIRLPLA